MAPSFVAVSCNYNDQLDYVIRALSCGAASLSLSATAKWMCAQCDKSSRSSRCNSSSLPPPLSASPDSSPPPLHTRSNLLHFASIYSAQLNASIQFYSLRPFTTAVTVCGTVFQCCQVALRSFVSLLLVSLSKQQKQ